MINMSYTVTGTEPLMKSLGRMPTEVMDDAVLETRAVMLGMRGRVRTYPTQPEPSNPDVQYVRGKGTLYVPTGRQYNNSQRYGASSNVSVKRDDKSVEGKFTSHADYSGYVRGTLTPGMLDPAWMHKGVWEPLHEIVDETIPMYQTGLKRIISDYIRRNDL